MATWNKYKDKVEEWSKDTENIDYLVKWINIYAFHQINKQELQDVGVYNYFEQHLQLRKLWIELMHLSKRLKIIEIEELVFAWNEVQSLLKITISYKEGLNRDNLTSRYNELYEECKGENNIIPSNREELKPYAPLLDYSYGRAPQYLHNNKVDTSSSASVSVPITVININNQHQKKGLFWSLTEVLYNYLSNPILNK